MKTCAIFLALFLLYSGRCVNGLLEDTKRILSEFKQKYNNSQSDLIFLMDVSGSVSDYGFQSEKIFVDNLLNEFSVAPYSSRVAVITFGRNVQTNINFIDIDPLSKEFQKCSFKPLFQYNVHHRYGWATNMKEAFKRTLDLLDTTHRNEHKRELVHTVAIMITDGWWNMGDPIENANKLKGDPDNVDLFTVGVDGYNKYQLTQLASTPSHVLEFSTFTQFRELAMYIRGDAHDKLFMEVDTSKCTVTNGCDPLAFCGCGTVSGEYQCVCPTGYYGTGIPGHCYQCPYGSYKLWPSPDDCLPCPSDSTTDALGSTQISDCKCKTGFKGDPKSGIPCRPVECEELLAPDNGRFLASCGHVYNDVCDFECSIGYTLVGTSSRRCQSDKEWSGIHPVCEIVTCSVLPTQAHGTKTCTGKGYEYGDSCSFTCDVGYERKGSSVRTCQLDTQWSGQQTTCEARHCPALRQLAFGSVDPVDCVTTTQPYENACIMTCYNGYVRTGDNQLSCGADGTWQGVYPTCEDQQPPQITCPPDVIEDTDPERPTRLVTWSAPVFSDNAQLHDNNAVPTLTRNPKDIVSPYDFSPGTTTVTYTATDRSNNSQSCVFSVTITDNEPPKIYCPQNFEVQKESSKQTIKVYWPPPRYWDNSGIAVTIFTSSVNGSDFTKGQYQIQYEATDHVGNKASCSFIILVSAVRCKPYDPPINGSLACSPFFSDDLCTPSCNEEKEFSRIPAAWYSCNAKGEWVVFDPRPQVIKTMPWPDCTEEYVPNAARKGMVWQYFSGDCTDPTVQNQIKENFIKTFNEVFGNGDQNYCQSQNLCSLDNIKVTCGRQKRRKKRSQSVVTIDVDVSVFTHGGSYGEAKNALEGNVTKAKSSPSMQSFDVPGSESTSLVSVNETETYAVCIEGSVFELNVGITSKDQCQNCPAGTFYDRGLKNCTKCPINTYNTYTGQLQCLDCPDMTYTLDIGTKNLSLCLAACQQGEYSPTGLANCEACPINSYQSLLRQSSCNSCPGSSVTLAEGAKSISECGMPCAPGTYSQTGVEPCLPCPKGKYQPDTNQKSCLPCDGSKSTYGVGASTIGQCMEIDDCASNPCNNGATCLNDETGFYCVCKAGFTGENCDIEENECTSNPCAQGATCVDKVNEYTCLCPPEYSGLHCDVKINSCDSNKCASGSTCVNSPTGHECICPEGYGGTFCETQINNCNSSPCMNGARCFNENNSYRCECPPGFSGNTCEKNDNGCLPDSCLNSATCRETSYGHECDCSAGFAGLRCEVDVNECSSTPCQNNGQCVDQVNGYKCYCKPSFYGTNCETEVSTDFDFTFHRGKGRGVSIVEMRQELRAFTIAFWMRASDTQLDPGTPISYAVQVGETLQDNALVIHDYNGFNIWINGQKASTNVAANDNKWHHVAATWQSATGRWKIYKDGSEVRNNLASEVFQMGQVIAAGGLFVLGQEQDALGGNFTASEAFIGDMSQLNIWSYELDASDIADMAKHANSIIGNVVAWSDFFYRKDDGLNVTMPSAARTENKCWGDWLNSDSPTSGDGDEESRPGSCPKPSLYDCQDVEGRSMNDLELNLTVPCMEDGIKCLNSEQRTGRSCPDFKVRFVCPCPVNSACSGNPCGQHGTCEHLPVGYKCKCNDGYEGRNCDTANQCPYLGTIANGMETGSRNIGDTTTVTCNAGFKASGTSTLTCVGGRWNAHVPQCVDVDECTEGGASCGHSCVNTIGSYKCKCNAGYALQADGSCTDINECDTNNGNCQQSCHNNVGSYRCTCASGYHLAADSRSCVDDDECNGGLGPCDHICTNTLASFQCLCRPGYILDGDGTTCQASSCAAISSPAHGSMVPANPETSVDSTVQFNCDDGYTLRGSSARTCQADGAWSGISSTCEVTHCIIPGDLLNGQRSSLDNIYNTVVTYSCNSGFRLVGSGTRTCQADGTWSGTHPRCIAADCPEPGVPTNGQLIGLQRKTGDTIRFECDLGYNIAGDSYAICQQNGAWTSPTPTCQVVNCGAPPAVTNGQVHGSDYTYSAKVTFSCNAANFKLSGSAERTCQVDGSWSGTQPVCLENSCGNPGTPSNGQKIGENYKYHDVVTFECNVGYNLVGSSSRTCQTDNFWDGTQPTCQVVDCGDPGTPANGERYGSVFTYGRTISYDCEPGYQLTGTRSRTCQLDGQWSGSVVSCVVSSCGASLVGPSGDIKSPNNPNVYPSNAYCRWKVSVPSDKKVMVTFNSFKTQKNYDVVEIFDGVSRQEITVLSGVYSNPVVITSESNAIDIKFVADGSDESDGFSATFQQVSCGGFVTQLDEVIMSPNYPSNYPDSVTCAWSLNIGQPFQLEFEQFYTESAHDLLTAYSSLSSFDPNFIAACSHQPICKLRDGSCRAESDLVFYMEGQRLNEPVQVTTGKMHLLFKSNYRLNYPGFKFTIKKYQVLVGK